MMSEKNGYVGWQNFQAALLGMMVIIITLWAFSVSDGEFTQYAKGVDDRFDSIEKRFESCAGNQNRNTGS